MVTHKSANMAHVSVWAVIGLFYLSLHIGYKVDLVLKVGIE